MLGIRGAAAAGGGEADAGPPRPPGPSQSAEEAPPGRAGCFLTGLVKWKQRPCRTSALFAAVNAVLWFVAFSSLRAYSLLAGLLALLVVTVTVRDVTRSRYSGCHLWHSMNASWEIIDPGRDRRSGTGPQLSDSLRVFLQETSAFKQQNPGKFCLLVCSLCTFFAVMGRYIPGIVISYFAVLAVFLWPLVSSHEVGLWLKPVLQKLDFGIGDFLQKLKENRERRVLQAEREGIESDLSSMFPKLDSTACKEMSVSDTEASDVTWTDTGTFNLSEGHTPQTETSDDLDREEAFSGGLPEFPSLDSGATTNGDDDDLDLDLDLGLDLHLPAARRRHRARSEPAPPAAALGVLGHMAGEAIAAAVSAAMQEQIEAAVSSMAPSSGLLELDDESDSDAEDFELLDQSELEQLEGELGLGEKKDPARAEEGDEPASPGFLSRLLRRH